MTIAAEAPVVTLDEVDDDVVTPNRALQWVRDHWAVPAVAVLSMWITLRHPMTFDGAMNLQVSQSVAAGRGYARHYDTTQYFPAEIQTSGPILLLGAFFILVFGQHNLVYQLPYVVAMTLLVYAASFVVKGRYANVLLLLFFIGMPELVQLGYNGYGEIALAAIELGAMVFAAKAVASRNIRLMEISAFLVGVGVITKVVGLAVLIPFAVALWFFWKENKRFVVLVRIGAAMASGLVLWEIYRLFALGSLTTWREWWAFQIDAVRTQAGETNVPQLPIQHAVWQRLGTLADAFGSGRMTIGILLCFVVFALCFGAWKLRGSEELRETFIIRLTLASMISAYFVWWFFITSDEKAWLRRVFIALVFVLVAMAHLLAGALADIKRNGFASRPDFGALAVAFVLLIVGPAAHNLHVIERNDGQELSVINAAADFVRAQPDDARFFGVGWWSAPVISAYSEHDFLNLNNLNRCELRHNGDYLVLDRYASVIGYRDTPIEAFQVTQLGKFDFGGYTTIYKIGPPPECPNG